MSLYLPIPSNPYIAGNPINDKAMFFGRDEDFQFIREKFLNQEHGLILTLAGERRSGKTSILFQIRNGRLGDGFIPFFIDMQSMAGIEDTPQFLGQIANIMCKASEAPDGSCSLESIQYDEFELAIDRLRKQYEGTRIIFMIDEYEIIEKKIEEGKISSEIIPFCARLMEYHNILFLFAGSNNLENRNAIYWKPLFTKSYHKRIPYLNYTECCELITSPLENYVNYSDAQLKNIYRLSAGQPYYTQLICQRVVDQLLVENRNVVNDDDLDDVVSEILASPIYPMIYFWNDFNKPEMICLSLLSKILPDGHSGVEVKLIIEYLKKNDLSKIIREDEIIAVFGEMCNKEILLKRDNAYSFRMDFLRKWIAHEQDIWKLESEMGF